MTAILLKGIYHACFGLSYLVALLLELGRVARPAAAWRAGALAFGVAGLAAHTFYILVHKPDPATPSGSLLVLAWVLALFYFIGSFNHAKQAWAVFVLPVVLLLVAMSYALFTSDNPSLDLGVPAWASGERFWGAVHGTLILFAAVGVSVAFVASTMYLVQSRRLRNKVNPGRGVPLLSLERLEGMNRHAVMWAFPFLTVGLLVGTLLLRHDHSLGDNWLSPKVLTTAALWVVFLVLTYLRYGSSVPPRQLAWLSIGAFLLMLAALGTAHPFAAGGGS
ncbi:cytochrome c biogenesis protein CcsA [Gemmata sp.]|uniref:cytochrome c biogenesis protein CcsA n=1 Tax=Gemmata sp. TaxID=1914242 RepID=UPI003F720E85